jgi:hypothetical protein
MSKIMSCQESICILFRYIIKFHFFGCKKKEKTDPFTSFRIQLSRPAHVQGQQRLPTKLHIRTSSAFKPATNKSSASCSADSFRLMGKVLGSEGKDERPSTLTHLFPAQDLSDYHTLTAYFRWGKWMARLRSLSVVWVRSCLVRRRRISRVSLGRRSSGRYFLFL